MRKHCNMLRHLILTSRDLTFKPIIKKISNKIKNSLFNEKQSNGIISFITFQMKTTHSGYLNIKLLENIQPFPVFLHMISLFTLIKTRPIYRSDFTPTNSYHILNLLAMTTSLRLTKLFAIS